MTEIYSVAAGELRELTDIKDDVFSKKMLGDGFGISTLDPSVYSPVSGKISLVYETGYAIGIQCSDGVEILIHIGLDTVELAGTPFEVFVQSGDVVDNQTALVRVDWNLITEQGYDKTIVVVSLDNQMVHQIVHGSVQRGQTIASVES
ncbi:PTS sugar transporter subunit IIA [Enterococcus casseliflavus]|uniref:PTS sugar transporter subunit IIA n=1 Tax=Enterococcus casseliflavus TaxID=37734 RepID=UPI001E652BD2|nr:PTS glucose transporter subunit IIA [Enterococcus casseliflavus]MCD4962552.1 PTS glucose transporter subunit IIA [Enterococcus casseliflavus]